MSMEQTIAGWQRLTAQHIGRALREYVASNPEPIGDEPELHDLILGDVLLHAEMLEAGDESLVDTSLWQECLATHHALLGSGWSYHPHA
jgi:hypothetical protein